MCAGYPVEHIDVSHDRYVLVTGVGWVGVGWGGLGGELLVGGWVVSWVGEWVGG